MAISTITVSVLPRRGANPKWHTLSRFCVTRLFVIVQMAQPLNLFPINKHPRVQQLYPARGKLKICTPYQCFFLSYRLANSKFAYPISVCSCPAAWPTQNINVSCHLIFNICTPYHCFGLAPSRGKPKMAYPITLLRYATFCDRPNGTPPNFVPYK